MVNRGEDRLYRLWWTHTGEDRVGEAKSERGKSGKEIQKECSKLTKPIML